MRTTVDLDDDTVAAIELLRQREGVGLSRAVNDLIRRGLIEQPTAPRFVQPTADLGIRIDVGNVAEALDLLEGSEHR